MIPQQKITMIPQNQYNKIMDLFDNIYEDFECDQIEIRKKYYLQCFNIIKNKVVELLKSDIFWILYSMHYKYCDYIYKNGPMRGMICGSRVDIKCDINKGKSKCYHHISKTIYNSEKRDNVDINRKCIGLTKYGKKMFPCKNLKWNHSNYCKVHFKIPNKVTMNKAFYEYYFKNKLFDEEINFLYKIYIGIEEMDKELHFNQEIEKFLNIDYICDNTHNNINFRDILEIKDNNKICLENNCYNKMTNGEDLCQEHVDEQRSVIYDYAVENLEEYIKEVIKINIDIENIIYNRIFNTDYNINVILNNINKDIEENKENVNNFVEKCNKILNEENTIINNNSKLDFFNKKNIYEIITNLINNETYINISYLKKSLNDYNLKFKNFKKEVFEDFPQHCKRIKGYFDIIEQDLDICMQNKIEMAMIKSKFLFL